jgi:Protein of unknown function (DUF3489)
MVKHAKSGTLAEIVEAAGWQKHTVRGFVSILGSRGGPKIESSKYAVGERSYHIREVGQIGNVLPLSASQRRFRFPPGAAFLLCAAFITDAPTTKKGRGQSDSRLISGCCW